MRTHSEHRSRSLFSSLGLAAVVAAVAVSTGHAPIRAEQSTQSSQRGAAGQSETLLPDGGVLLVGGEADPRLVAIRRPDGTTNKIASAPLTPGRGTRRRFLLMGRCSSWAELTFGAKLLRRRNG